MFLSRHVDPSISWLVQNVGRKRRCYLLVFHSTPLMVLYLSFWCLTSLLNVNPPGQEGYWPFPLPEITLLPGRVLGTKNILPNLYLLDKFHVKVRSHWLLVVGHQRHTVLSVKWTVRAKAIFCLKLPLLTCNLFKGIIILFMEQILKTYF